MTTNRQAVNNEINEACVSKRLKQLDSLPVSVPFSLYLTRAFLFSY
jgi:hypothetical protein